MEDRSEFANGVWVVSGVFSIPLEAVYSPSNTVCRDGTPEALRLRQYIGSDENRLVQFAAQRLLAADLQYNPLVLYGPTGTGKTLLARGLADRWLQDHQDAQAVVTSGSEFARTFANAVDTDGLAEFRDKFRTVACFVLDDVHSMRQKRPAQEELVRTIDTLLGCSAVILITGSRAPSLDDALVSPLRSRLSSGLAVALVAPGIPARRLLLRRLADLHEVELPDEAIELLAQAEADGDALGPTVPHLNHAVLQLGHEARVAQCPINVAAVRGFLEEQANERRPTLRSITTKVARYFSLTVEELRGASRRQHIVRARGIGMLLAWKRAGKSLGVIGQYFGKRDHTTVLHACRRTESLAESDSAISTAIDELNEQLSAR